MKSRGQSSFQFGFGSGQLVVTMNLQYSQAQPSSIALALLYCKFIFFIYAVSLYLVSETHSLVTLQTWAFF